jgi:hypothetical protein
MAEGLRTLGADIVDLADGDGDWQVTPGAVRGGGQLDCGLAGTVMRFLPPVAALADGPVRFDGDEGARLRPMGPILDALRALGVGVDDDDQRASLYGPGLRRPGRSGGRGHPGRFAEFAVRVAVAAGRRSLRARGDGPPRRQTRAEPTAHRDDRGDLACGWGRRRRHRGQHLAGEPGPHQRAGRHSSNPTCPTRGPSSPPPSSRAARCSSPTGRQPTTQAGDLLREILAAMGAHVEWSRSGLTGHQRRHRPGHRRRPARGERAHPDRGGAGRAGRQRPPGSAGLLISAATRPTDWPPWTPSSPPWAPTSSRPTTASTDPTSTVAGQAFPHLSRPSDGDGRCDPRVAGARPDRRERRHHRQDPAGLHRPLGCPARGSGSTDELGPPRRVRRAGPPRSPDHDRGPRIGPPTATLSSAPSSRRRPGPVPCARPPEWAAARRPSALWSWR